MSRDEGHGFSLCLGRVSRRVFFFNTRPRQRDLSKSCRFLFFSQTAQRKPPMNPGAFASLDLEKSKRRAPARDVPLKHGLQHASGARPLPAAVEGPRPPDSSGDPIPSRPPSNLSPLFSLLGGLSSKRGVRGDTLRESPISNSQSPMLCLISEYIWDLGFGIWDLGFPEGVSPPGRYEQRGHERAGVKFP